MMLVGPVIILLILGTLVAFIVSVLHYALRDFSMVKLDALIEKRGHRSAIDHILDDIPGHVLSTGALRVVAQVVVVMCTVTLTGAFEVFARHGAGIAFISWRMFVAMLAASAIVYVFSVVLPVSVAEHAGERLLYTLSRPLRILHVMVRPLRWINMVDVAVKRLAGVAHISEAEEAEDEILSAVSEGEREGTIGEEEREMIEGIVELRSRTVEAIMTPRTEIEGFELTDDLDFIRGFIERAGHSRIPVYEGDLDHIAGILYAKDLLAYLGRDTADFKLRPILRKPVWMPETKPLSATLVELRARKVHLAIVLDEYGGTTGLVTFEDILEEIVGEIHDEFEPDDESLPEIVVDEHAATAEIEARAYIDDANEALKPIGITIPEAEEYDTVGGFVLTHLGHIPVSGEIIEADGFAMAVLRAEPTRVTRLRIEARPIAGDVSAAAPSPNGAVERPASPDQTPADAPAKEHTAQ